MFSSNTNIEQSQVQPFPAIINEEMITRESPRPHNSGRQYISTQRRNQTDTRDSQEVLSAKPWMRMKLWQCRGNNRVRNESATGRRRMTRRGCDKGHPMPAVDGRKRDQTPTERESHSRLL
ncbi:uncharacterized protein LOC135169721 [Diachasmimorpha longicaudata]|uniref:uncharacterized protein LOC135169721 n=1 Tax=Diachasmimorpha longicaudata TaxID=58733 RepID=UPI0030B90078